jgi:predicted flap endonuclease-1-like 5' DNA nuclease
MWPVCSDANLLWGLLPLLIGLITGWWAWARRGAATSDVVSEDVAPATVSDSDPDGDAAIGASAAMVAPVTLAKVNAPDRLPQAAPEPVAPPLPPIDAGVATDVATALTAIGVPAASGPADDLRQIKGIGPKLNTLLISLGITRFDQIAAWSVDDIEKVDAHLGSFKNRIGRDNWVEQAGLLAKGLISEFEAKFGKLDSENR